MFHFLKAWIVKKHPPNPIWWSAIVTGLLFLGLFLFGRASYNSVDDFYFLYTLGGGYGIHPSTLLHYIFALHPLVTWPVAKLFGIYPELNWYTLFLLFFHFTGCINLLYTFEKLYQRRKAALLFLLFFFFSESHLLLSLQYSTTSLLLAISGLFSLLISFRSADETQKIKTS